MQAHNYRAEISQFAQAHRGEIERDLSMARRAREQAELDLAEATQQIAGFEFLLSLAGDSPALVEQRTTLHEAMKLVLEAAPGRRMPATDIAREINRRGLYQMRDGRPVEAQQIHARAGNYAGFNRNDRGIGLD